MSRRIYESGRVLVVDDDERNRKLMGRFLQSKGYEVDEARDGMEALECVSRLIPDVILLDVMMPKMDGFEACRRIKGDESTSHIPVLLVTMLSERQDRLTGIEAGANDFLSKPIDLDETLLRVKNAVTQKRLFDENLVYQQQLEDLVEERTKELRRAFEELKSSQEQIIQQEKLATIGQLSAGVAHEINTPTSYITLNLASIRDELDRLCQSLAAIGETTNETNGPDGAGKEKQCELTDIGRNLGELKELTVDALEGAGRIAQIVKSLNNFSRRDDELCEADINECIESTLKFVWNELKYKAEVIKKFSELPPIICHPRQLSQVFTNLLVNAAHAIEKHGTVTITTAADGDDIVIKIADTGSGISEENLAKIFGAFFTTKEPGKGTGLGLSIVSKIIEKHHGTIAVDSRLGEGTTFTIRLPVSCGEEGVEHL